MSDLDSHLAEEPYVRLGEGYDRLAPSYDAEIGGNLVGRRMRRIFRQAMLETFPRNSRLLEIGCGTGSEAIWLAGLGYEILATDNSQRMLDQAFSKAQRRQVTEAVDFRKLPAGSVGLLTNDYGSESFDGAYCHAGALNMEPNLSSVPEQLQALLRPEGRFLCSVVNKASLFETVFYSLVLKPRKGFRRLGNVIPVPISRVEPLNAFVVQSRFYSPNDLKGMFSPNFTLEALRGMQILLPPANLTREYEAFRPLFGVAEWIEERLSDRSPFNSWGNHSILTFRRN